MASTLLNGGARAHHPCLVPALSWAASRGEVAGVLIDDTSGGPEPMIDVKESRKTALAAYSDIKGNR